MNYETEDEHIDRRLGFPVLIGNAPKRISPDGHSELAIRLDQLHHAALKALVGAVGPWSGNQALFVRKWFQEPVEPFADELEIAVSRVEGWWESGAEPTDMSKGTEYLLRSRVALELYHAEVIESPTLTRLMDRALGFETDREPVRIDIDGRKWADDNWMEGAASGGA